MFKKVFGFCVVLLLLASCSSIVTEDPTQESVRRGEISFKISPESAIEIAREVIEGCGVRTKSQRTLKSIELLKDAKTRSGISYIPDSALYLVNFADEGGYALISADIRMHVPFYAFSDVGNLSLNDTSENKALALTMNTIYADINNNWVVDSVNWGNPTPGLQPIFPSDKEIKLLSEVSPLTHKNVRRWGQGTPFNSYCYTPSGEKAWAGCSSVSIAIVLSCFEWPLSYKGESFNWKQMKESDKGNHAVYKLIKFIGDPDNINVDYQDYAGNTGSGGSITKNASRTFKNFGYDDCEKFETYNMAKAKSVLSSKRPIIMMGGYKKSNEEYYHAWVIDGCRNYIEKASSVLDQPKTYTYMHCVWGWNGKNDGYFYNFEPTPVEKDDDDDKENSTAVRNFDVDLRMLWKFVPIK